MPKVILKSNRIDCLSEVAHNLVWEGIDFSFDSTAMTLAFSVNELSWLFSQLINLKIKDINYVETGGKRYNYMGEELVPTLCELKD